MVRNKRGAEIWELAKILMVAVLLGILVWAIIYLFKGKGGELLSTIKDTLRFGRA